MSYFNHTDVFDLEQELDVEKRAQDDGWQDRPSSSDATLDDTQLAIMGAINERLNAARVKGGEAIKAIEVKLGTIDLGATMNALNGLKSDTEMEIDRTKGRYRDRLIGLRREERGLLREKNAFQLRNKLHRSPEYPQSEILHWAIVVALIVTESLANSYFFAKGSDLGLLGGAFQALLISCVNVGAALFAGIYVLRNLQHVEKWRVGMAGLGLSGYLVFVGFFNLATAHYRAQLGIDPLTALVKVFQSLFRNPFGINDFDATILLFIGFIFSFAALIKAYVADDRYPGYGKVDRRYLEADDAYQEGKQNLRDAVHSVINRAREALNEIVGEARSASLGFSVQLAEAENIANEYSHHTAELSEARNTLLNIYRSTNVRVRTSAPPAYFEEYPPVQPADPIPAAELDLERKRAILVEEDLARIEDSVPEKMEALRTVSDLAMEDVEAFFREIEQEAEKQEARDAAWTGPQENVDQ